MFPDLSNRLGEGTSIMADRNCSQNYENKTEALINWTHYLNATKFYANTFLFLSAAPVHTNVHNISPVCAADSNNLQYV